MKTNNYLKIAFPTAAFLLFGIGGFERLNASEADDSCDVVIVGAGAGGMHTAYRMAAEYGNRLCVLEKQGRVGGRFYDIALDAQAEKTGQVIGNGARRIMEGQNVLFDLAEELEITYDTPNTGADLIFAKGRYATNTDAFFDLYPGLPVNVAAKGYEDQLIEQLFKSDLRKKIQTFRSFKQYALAVIGESGFDYLHDMSRFRGDFEYDLSAQSYLDWLEEEVTYCCQTYYPHGGMSVFTSRMYEKVLALKGRVFLSEPVASIEKQDDRYAIQTPKRRFVTKQLIIAVPPVGLNKISGSIAEKIKSTDQFKSILPIKATVINQWYDTAWWLDLKTNKGDQVWRAYTTIDKNKLDGRCINFVEFAPESAAIDQKAIRSVYNDQEDCVEMWAELEQKGEIKKRDDLIRQGLQGLIDNRGVTTSIKVPEALKTSYWQWQGAWHWLAAGSKYSNQDIFDWAVEPLEGENISLVGEAYNPQRSTWSDAAFKSSIHLLEKKFKNISM